VQALFEKLSKEKVKIFDLQQQHHIPNNHQINDVINYDIINLTDLQHNYELLISENKILEVRRRFNS
jgi:hypothetical protein